MGFAKEMLQSLRRRARVDRGPGGGPAEAVPEVPVDDNARAFWQNQARVPSAGERVSGQPAPQRSRVRALLATHERGAERDSGRPRGNPAFSEALFVELMRAQQFGRAFRLLSPECQRHWGNLERFTVAHSNDDSLRHLRGVEVIATREADGWTDPELGAAHDHVAELDVEYSFGAGQRSVTMRRTVHLVGVGGKWRSLCYPADRDLSAAP